MTEPKEEKAPDSDSELPAVDFSTFVLSLGHSALVHLGVAPDLPGVKAEKDLLLAKQTIDLLGILSEKTKGNLTGEEERLMEQLLYDLRAQLSEAKQSSP